MSARREELTKIAARLFAAKGYQGTSLADLAEELGVQKPSLYHHIASKEDLLWEVARAGAGAFHAALDAVPAEAPAAERIRLALRAHLAVVAGQLDVATAALLFLSAANWAYTWLRAGAETDGLADRLYAALLDGMRGYATPD